MQSPRSQDNILTMVGLDPRATRFYTDGILGEQWPELLGALFQASQSADSGQRECSFRIFATTPGIIEKQHEGIVQEVFGKGFKDSSVDVGLRSWMTLSSTDLGTGSSLGCRSVCIVFPFYYQESSN